MLSTLWEKVSEAGMTLIGFVIFGVIFLGPWLVARAIPVQAYTITEIAAAIAFIVSIFAALLAIVPAARQVAGIVIVISAAIVWLFIWVWSVLIVDGTWGLITLYVANFFLAVGAIVLAFIAALLGAHWSILGQLALCIIIAFAMQFGGGALIESTKN